MSGHIIKILPHGRKIEVCSEANLFTSLVEHSIFLRSDCGGRGVCRKCLVELTAGKDQTEPKMACRYNVEQDIDITIPYTSMLSTNIVKKAPAILPESFQYLFDKNSDAPPAYGVAVDLGTTTIALYFCDMTKGSVMSSLSMKNPQALYGDDVMSRIGAIAENPDNLDHLQKLVVKTIEWGCKKLSGAQDVGLSELSKMLVVGNPAMIHIFMGIDPQPIGVAPYKPAFYDARCVNSSRLGFEELQADVHTLPQISGFIGGDILAATIAAELIAQPAGTLVVDIGTNGELVYKGAKGLYATSCATGPAFEGASISCGVQAFPAGLSKKLLSRIVTVNRS